jgi:hypothetical protein
MMRQYQNRIRYPNVTAVKIILIHSFPGEHVLILRLQEIDIRKLFLRFISSSKRL